MGGASPGSMPNINVVNDDSVQWHRSIKTSLL